MNAITGLLERSLEHETDPDVRYHIRQALQFRVAIESEAIEPTPSGVNAPRTLADVLEEGSR